MRGIKARQLRKTADQQTIGKPAEETKSVYRLLKKRFKNPGKL